VLATAIGIVHHSEDASRNVFSHLGELDLKLQLLEQLDRLRVAHTISKSKHTVDEIRNRPGTLVL
jgi:hypothetical protein